MNLQTLLFLARKDLFKDWRVLFLVLLAVGSGALAIIPLNGMLSGFTASLTATTVDVAVGHVIVAPPKGETTIRDVPSVVTEMATQPNVRAVAPRLYARAMASHRDETESVVIRGVEAEAESRATTIADYIVAGCFLDPRDQDTIVIGRSLADRLELQVGERVRLLLANGNDARFLVQGIYDTGVRDLDSGGYISLRRLQTLLGLRGHASEIVVRLTDKEQSANFASQLSTPTDS